MDSVLTINGVGFETLLLDPTDSVESDYARNATGCDEYPCDGGGCQECDQCTCNE